MLKALAPITAESIHQRVVRGRYAAGNVGGVSVPGYLDEENSNAQSSTETFVALRADICNWRWSGVPFYLRTGKRGAETVADRHPFQGAAVLHLRPRATRADQQSPDHPPATG